MNALDITSAQSAAVTTGASAVVATGLLNSRNYQYVADVATWLAQGAT